MLETLELVCDTGEIGGVSSSSLKSILMSSEPEWLECEGVGEDELYNGSHLISLSSVSRTSSESWLSLRGLGDVISLRISSVERSRYEL